MDGRAADMDNSVIFYLFMFWHSGCRAHAQYQTQHRSLRLCCLCSSEFVSSTNIIELVYSFVVFITKDFYILDLWYIFSVLFTYRLIAANLTTIYHNMYV